MAAKLLAIGPNKYVGEPLNLLDTNSSINLCLIKCFPKLSEAYKNQIEFPYLSYTIKFRDIQKQTIAIRNISGQLLFLESERCKKLLTYSTANYKTLVLPDGLDVLAIKNTLSYIHGLKICFPKKQQILPLYTVLKYFEMPSLIIKLINQVENKHGNIMKTLFQETDEVVKNLSQIILE